MINRLKNRLVREISYLCAITKGIKCDQGVTFHGIPIVEIRKGGKIHLGKHVAVVSRSTMTALGVSHPVIFRLLRPDAVIEIGDNSGLSGTTICAAISVTIGEETMFGADVIIADTDFHALAPDGRRYESRPEKIAAQPVVIGRNVFIGTRSIILKGVTIGDNSVIGAGSIVSKSIPENVIAAGNPCRVIKKLT